VPIGLVREEKIYAGREGVESRESRGLSRKVRLIKLSKKSRRLRNNVVTRAGGEAGTRTNKKEGKTVPWEGGGNARRKGS